MTNRYYIGIDCGTSGTKTVLICDSGEIVSKAYCGYPLIKPGKYMVEQDANRWWEAVVQTVLSCCQGIDKKKVKAMAVSAQAGCAVPVKNGAPLDNALSWLDARAHEVTQRYFGLLGNDTVYGKTGWPVSAGMTFPKIIWYKENKPSIFEAADKFLSTVDYINFKLTGEYVIDPSNAALGIDEGIFVGEDAEITINNYKVIRSSNTFVIDGIEYNLRGTTDKPISFSVSQNIDTTVNKIKDFINAYNELVENLNNRIYEEKNYNYTPLTEAQKKEMKEEDIAKWEEQAKKGLLRNDIGISTLLNELRASVYQKIEGLNLSLADIGITTGAYNDRGKLVIDEQKLRNALKENGDNVMKLFTQNSSSEDKSVKYKESGFIPRLLSSFTDYNGKVDFDALSQKINEYKDHIKELEYKMYLKGEKYYKKFAAMESALAKMNSQSMWLAQQLGMY